MRYEINFFRFGVVSIFFGISVSSMPFCLVEVSIFKTHRHFYVIAVAAAFGRAV